MLPKYICQSCHKVWYGWSVILTCQICGGKLELLEEKKETIRKEEVKR